MKFNVQKHDRKYSVGKWEIEIEGEDLKNAVTDNIARIIRVTRSTNDTSIAFPLKIEAQWNQRVADEVKKYHTRVETVDDMERHVSVEYTPEEDRGSIKLTMTWEHEREGIQTHAVYIKGNESDVEGLEPWVIEGK